jgi:hypothetical protein
MSSAAEPDADDPDSQFRRHIGQDIGRFCLCQLSLMFS